MGQKVHPVGFRLGTTSYHLSQWFATKNYSKYLFEDDFLRKVLLQRYRNAGFEKIEIFRKMSDSGDAQDAPLQPAEAGGPFEEQLEIRIHCLRPFILIGNSRRRFSASDPRAGRAPRARAFQQEIKQILNQYNPSKRKVLLYVLESSETSASAMADFLIYLLERRVPYRVALKKLQGALARGARPKPTGRPPDGRRPSPTAGQHPHSAGQAWAPKASGFKVQISGRLNGAEIARSHCLRNGKLPLQTLDAHIDYCFKQAQTIYGLLGIKVWVLKPKVNWRAPRTPVAQRRRAKKKNENASTKTYKI